MSVESKTKPEPVSNKDSAFVEGISVAINNGDEGNIQVETATSSSGSLKPISEGVVAEENHSGNLVEEADNSMPVAVPESQTQPHSELPVTSNSVTVLPEVKRMEQENKELKAQLAEKTNCIESLKEKFEREKTEIEGKLYEKERELQSVKEQTNNEIQKLKLEIEALKEWKNENKTNLAEKEREIERLRDKEDKCQKEIDKLKEEKHRLDLKIQKMEAELQKTEAKLKGEIKFLEEQIKQTQGRIEVQVSESIKAKAEKLDPKTICFVTACVCVTVLGWAYFKYKK